MIAAALTAVAAIAAGCGTQTATTTTLPGHTTVSTRHSTPNPGGVTRDTVTTPARSSPSTSTSSAPNSAAASAARAFASAYGRYLDGQLVASAMPDASSTARAQLGPAIPPVRRAGPLAVQAVQQAPAASTFVITLRDRAHTFGAQLTLSHTNGRWLVVGVAAPDLDTILAPPTRPIPPPVGSGPAQHAAHAFLPGYLAWLYGHGPARAIADATSSLRAQLQANPPNVPPAFQARHARLVALGLKAAPGGAWTGFASVTDGQETYELTVTVVHENGRWLVSNVNSPQ